MASRSPVFITRKIPGRGLEMLRREFGDVAMNDLGRQLAAEELEEEVAGRQAVICMLNDRIDGHLLAAAADCRIFANYAVGYENIDVAKATRRGILVANTPGVLTDATADLAWTLLMSAARRVLEGDTLVRSGLWRGWSATDLLGVDLSRVGAVLATLSIDYQKPLELSDGEVMVSLDVPEIGESSLPMEYELHRPDGESRRFSLRQRSLK